MNTSRGEVTSVCPYSSPPYALAHSHGREALHIRLFPLPRGSHKRLSTFSSPWGIQPPVGIAPYTNSFPLAPEGVVMSDSHIHLRTHPGTQPRNECVANNHTSTTPFMGPLQILISDLSHHLTYSHRKGAFKVHIHPLLRDGRRKRLSAHIRPPGEQQWGERRSTHIFVLPTPRTHTHITSHTCMNGRGTQA